MTSIMKILKLSLSSTWFKAMLCGKRDVDYRPISPYYCSRLCANYVATSITCTKCHKNYCYAKPKTSHILFTSGRPSVGETGKPILKKVVEIRKGLGDPFKGAPRERCFIILVE